MAGYVYQIMNTVNGNRYVGVTSKNPPEKRFREHVLRSRRMPSTLLHCAMKEQGEQHFTFDIIEQHHDYKYARAILEPLLISQVRPEYNMTPGGNGGRGCGYHLSEGAKLKISQTHKGIPNGPMMIAHKKAISAGLQRSEKFKKSMKSLGESRRGKLRPPAVGRKVSKAKMGHSVSHSTRSKISASLKGRSNGPHARVTCPHCGKIGGNNSMPRWHFNNCKKREVLSWRGL